MKRFQFLKGTSADFNQKFVAVEPAINNDQDGVVSNGVFTAVPWKHNSTVAVFPAYKYSRFNLDQPLIKGHKGHVHNVAFSPFNDNILATSSGDGDIKLWAIPE